jgi:hypothetical protein
MLVQLFSDGVISVDEMLYNGTIMGLLNHEEQKLIIVVQARFEVRKAVAATKASS